MKTVFIFSEYSLHNHIIESYAEARPEDRLVILKVPLRVKSKTRLESARTVLPKLSRRFFVGKLLEFLTLLAITLLPKMLGRGAVFRRLSFIARRLSAPFHIIDNIASPAAVDLISREQPDLIVTMFHQIVPTSVIRCARLGVVNIHPGLLPRFKGIQPYFWELSEGSPDAGVSLHFIEDETIDTGRLLCTASYSLAGIRSVQLNYYLTAVVAAQVLPEVAGLLEAGTAAGVPQEGGQYFRWPDRPAYDRLSARGCSLLSVHELWGILTGRYDGFRPEKVNFGNADTE